MRRALVLLLVLGALGLAACGGDDEENAPVDADAYASCLEDAGLSVQVSDGLPTTTDLDPKPTATVSVTVDMTGDDVVSSPVEVVIFDDPDGPAAVEETTADDDIIATGSEGNVAWVYADLPGSFSDETETALRDCVGEAS